jgi:hypothetical protein
MARPWKPTPFWSLILYQSATNLAATGNSGIIASTAGTGSTVAILGNACLFPLILQCVGNGLATDETNTLTIDWYTDSAGTAGAIGTTTFAQMTAGAPIPAAEVWPGDVSIYNAARDMVPLFPFMKLTWTLAGTTKSMGFTVYISGTTYADY